MLLRSFVHYYSSFVHTYDIICRSGGYDERISFDQINFPILYTAHTFRRDLLARKIFIRFIISFPTQILKMSRNYTFLPYHNRGIRIPHTYFPRSFPILSPVFPRFYSHSATFFFTDRARRTQHAIVRIGVGVVSACDPPTMVDTRSSTHAGNVRTLPGGARTPAQPAPAPTRGASARPTPLVPPESPATSVPPRPSGPGNSSAPIFLGAETTPATRERVKEHASQRGLGSPNATTPNRSSRFFGALSRFSGQALRTMLLVTPARQVDPEVAPTARDDSNGHFDPFDDPPAAARPPPGDPPRA